MANPFRKFRKYQKRWLAGLGILVMISFVVLPVWMDTMSSGPSRDPVVVSTTRYGDLHESKVAMLVRDRSVLRGFFEHLAQAAMEAGGNGRALMNVAQALGSTGEEEVVQTWLMTKRAEELGIVVSDGEINQFLSDLIGQQNVTRETFRQVMQYRHISENNLFSMLRHELLALRLQQLFGISLGGVTPAQRWDYYQRLNEKARVEVAPLSVASFVDKVPDPDEATLQAFFEKYKKQYYDPASPEPGFHEPQKIALEYFKANVDAVAVSDAEIAKYYEENKDKEFVQETLPEVKKETPAAKEEKKEEAKPAAEQKPAEPKAEKPAPAEAKQPEKDAKQPEKKAEAKEPAKKESAKDKTSSVKAASPFRLAAYQQEKKEEDKKDAKPEAKQPAPAKKDVPKPAPPAEAPKEAKAKETKAEPKAPEAEKKAEQAQDTKPAAEPSKYIPLEKVKAQIRARLAEEKIRDTFSRIQDRMSRYHDELTLYDVHREDKSKKGTIKAPEKPDFKKLAEQNGLGFYTTPLISPLEVNELDIGQSFVGQNTPFIRFAFVTLPKFRPETSQDIDGNHFLFWKTDQAAERIPEFKEEGVRDRVLRAWKMVQARTLAQQEAKRLAAEAGKANKPLKEFFADQPKMIVHESEPFSWMTYGAFPAWWAQSPPQISKITAADNADKKDEKPGQETEIVDMPGDDFMRQVFRLEKGEVGVAMNQPETVVYVVRMVDTTPAIWQAFLAEDFSRYVRVAQQDQQSIAQAWRDNLKADVNFTWVRPPERDRRQAE